MRMSTLICQDKAQAIEPNGSLSKAVLNVTFVQELNQPEAGGWHNKGRIRYIFRMCVYRLYQTP